MLDSEPVIGVQHGIEHAARQAMRDRRAVLAIEVGQPGQDPVDTAARQQAGDQVVIFRHAQRRIVANPARAQRARSDHGLEKAQGRTAAAEQAVGAHKGREIDRPVAERVEMTARQQPMRPDRRIVVKDEDVVCNHVGVAGRLQHAFEALGMKNVVGIDDREPLASCPIECAVAGGSWPCIQFTHDDAHAGVPFRPAASDRNAVVGRSVVADDQLEIANALSQHRSDGVRQEARAVVVGHDDADDRVQGSASAARCADDADLGLTNDDERRQPHRAACLTERSGPSEPVPGANPGRVQASIGPRNRPPNRCTCRCGTSWPLSGPMFDSSR